MPATAWKKYLFVLVVAHIYPPVTKQRKTLTYWTIRTLFITTTTSWLEESTPAKGFPMIQCSCGFFSNSCPLNLLLVQSLQAEIIIVKHLIQGHNNVTRVQVESRSFDQSHRKKLRRYPLCSAADKMKKWASSNCIRKPKKKSNTFVSNRLPNEVWYWPK